MRALKTLLLGLAASAGLAGSALAVGEAKAPKDVDFSFEGPFGTFDRAQLQRGFQIYREVCASCHGLTFLAFRNLIQMGYDETMAKAIAAEYAMIDGPDEFGDMYERSGILADYLPAPFPNEAAARAANSGAYPPDLSLITEARMGGPEYSYSLLVGYSEPPAGEEVRPGLYWNDYFPGHLIAMPPPLFDGMVDYADGTEATVEQMSKDVTVFLAWVAEPTMEDRKKMGLSFMVFMVVFGTLLYLTNRKIWRPIKQGRTPLTEKSETGGEGR